MECKQNYSKMCGLFILQNTAIESEHAAKRFYENVWRTRGNIYYFHTRDVNKSMYNSKRCTLFTAVLKMKGF